MKSENITREMAFWAGWAIGGLVTLIAVACLHQVMVKKYKLREYELTARLLKQQSENENLRRIMNVEHTQTFRDMELLLPFPDRRETLEK